MMQPPLIKTAFSEQRQAQQAAAELFEGLYQDDLECVIFFCSVEYDLTALATALNQQFGDIPVLGCTTAGEITPLGYKRGTITGFSLPAKYFTVEAVQIKNLYNFSYAAAQDLMKGVHAALEARAQTSLEGHSFALSMLDGLAIREEMILNALNDSLRDVPLIGGSAGDALDFKDTHVFNSGEFCSDSAIIILINTSCPFEVFSSHHMQPTDTKLVVTAAEPESRMVQELNAEPAALEYARAIGVPLEDLGLHNYALHPVGVNIQESCFIRSIRQVNDDLSLTFFCAIDEGVVFSICERGDQYEHLRNRLAALEQAVGKPQLIVGCDCILRRLEVDHLQLEQRMSDLLVNYNVIGFETYGEQFQSMHVNQTFSGIAIGQPPN